MIIIFLDGIQAYLKEQRFTYEKLQASVEKPGRCAGVLIFDEVKIDARLVFCPKTGRIVGLCEGFDKYASLYDCFSTLDAQAEAKMGEFALQAIWRDTTSNFDIIGPTYMFPESIQVKNLAACLVQTLKIFHRFRFEVLAVIMDNAKVNVKLMQWLIQGSSGNLGVSYYSIL